MLLELSIRNFALIDKLNLKFDEHLNVLTGETGAGKSIIIDAVSLLLGARAQSHFIRAADEKTLIEGSFHVPIDHPVERILSEMGHDLADDRLLVLVREINSNGKNISRLNNRIINLTTLKKVVPELINIYGQHDFQSLSEKRMHLHLIDLLGDQSFKNDLELLKDLYEKWQQNVKKTESLKEKITDNNQRLDFLKFQTKEIADLNLTEEEDIEIENELKLLDNHEKIVSISHKSFDLLYGQNSSYDKISVAIEDIATLIDVDKVFSSIVSDLKSAQIDIEENARILNDYASNFEYDINRKNYLQEKHYEINKLKRKYGDTIKDILDYYEKAKEEINEIENSEFFIKELEEKERKSYEEYLLLAEKVSKNRKIIAKDLERKLTRKLKDLAMENTRFQVSFKNKEGSISGIDDLEFLISPNPGQDLKSLSKIASGGEMSRIMLALKVILAKVDSINTLIFDEIDAGIGGNTLVKVADTLATLAINCQVICVTHSPQIASLAHQHYLINKNIKNNETVTDVNLLTENERIEELARMLGGNDEITHSHAQELRKNVKLKNIL